MQQSRVSANIMMMMITNGNFAGGLQLDAFPLSRPATSIKVDVPAPVNNEQDAKIGQRIG
jgi:hypothetical protein